MDDFGATNMKTAGACVALAAVACAYEDNVAGFLALLGPGGELLQADHRPQSWPPSYMLGRDAAGNVLLAIAGTTNVTQAYGHVLGSFAESSDAIGVPVNGQWASVADLLNLEFGDKIPSPPAGKLLIAGHSYGAAVGHLLARRYAAAFGPGKVQLLTFGEPKALYGGATTAAPAAHWRVVSPADAVVPLPPATWEWLLLSAAGGGLFASTLADWTHYGERQELNWDGAINAPTPGPDVPPAWVSYSPIESHQLRNYYGRLRQLAARQEYPGASFQALSVAFTTLTGNPVQVVPPSLPAVVPQDDGDPIRPPMRAPDELFPATSPGVTPMAATPLTGGIPYKVSVKINAGPSGFTENYWVYITEDATAPHDLAAAWTANLLGDRKQIMSSNAEIIGFTVSNADTERDGVPYSGDKFNCGPGDVPGKMAHVDTGWLLNVTGLKGDPHTQRIYRAVPNIMLPGDTANPNALSVYPNAVTRFAKQLQTRLSTTYSNATVSQLGTLTPAVRTFAKTGLAGRRDLAQSVTENGSGYIVLTMGPDAQNLFVGDKIHLYAKRHKCIRGLSGDATIMQKVENDTTKAYTTDKRICCGNTLLAQVQVRVQRREAAYIAVAKVSINKLSDRDTGKAINGSRGRRSRKCC